MKNTNDLKYSDAISERLLQIMENSGLTINGFSEITKVSESHVYALINGNRDLTGSIAEKLGKPFRLKGWQILQLDYKIPADLSKSSDLTNFRKEFRANIEYFTKTKNNNKSSYYIEYELLTDPMFTQPIYLWEIIDELNKRDKKYNSKELSQILHYLISKGKLKNKKQVIKLKNGGFGTRIVDVFWK